MILRHRTVGADTTSKIFETSPPIAFDEESQGTVNILFRIFQILYLPFDWLIFQLDKNAFRIRQLPNWFMTLISIFGLGFQLMIMAIMLSIGWIDYIIPFFISYTALTFVFIGTRKLFIT